MNVDSQQFKDLLKQADIQLVYWDDSPRLYVKNMTSDQRLAKFAELIVQDCINVVEQQKAKMSYGPTFVIEDIKRHFGVGE